MTSLNGNGDFEQRPHPASFFLIGRDGSRHGPYSSLEEASWWANSFWPGQIQDDTLEEGWDVECAR